MKVFDSLSKQLEDFETINQEIATIYICGPTVYDFVHIGNLRTYTLGDLVHRTLLINNYRVKYIMNLTDVGHLTGDNLGDADIGGDRMEIMAAKEKKSARDIADFYIKDFYYQFEKMNYLKPEKFTRATDYIDEQIDLVKQLEKRGFTYEISDGVYFDTSKFADYGKLSGLDNSNIKEGARVEPNPQKKNPADFALWKFSPKDEKRWQEWDSPWGVGFPGWHIECSAMAMKELGETIDIHIGGEDLKMIHHQNEIAQSECATGKKYVKYWIHGAFLQVDSKRMGKSIGNAYTPVEIEDKGYSLMDLKYFFMTAHYRSVLNFTWEALTSAQNSLKKMYELVEGYKEEKGAQPLDKYMDKFMEAINDDFNTPKALSVLWEVLKSGSSESDKLVTILKMDEVFGLRIDDHIGFDIPQKVVDMAKTRQQYRISGIWDKADIVRKEIAELGYSVEDLPGNNFKLKRKI